MSLQPGTTLGRYQILEPLGIGGMATVYKAFQPALERVVALKVMRAGFAEDPEFVDRFRREAKAIARLRHPNIVQVYDFDEADGRYFMAMEYLEGGTLKDLVAKQSLPFEESAKTVAQVAEALSYAHGLGIVHRDVKPSNVILTSDGRAVVTDFGIARILGATSHTQTGVGIGTPEYMSPEQGQGQPIDHRADIYSLGVMAYEMFTGRVPFNADTPLAIVLSHIRDPLPLPSSLEPRIGESTEQVLLKALAKDPNARYATARDLAAALTASLDEDEATPTIVVQRPMVPAAVRATTVAPPAAPAPARRSTMPALFGRAWALPAAIVAVLILVSGTTAAVVGGLGRTSPPATSASTATARTNAPIAGQTRSLALASASAWTMVAGDAALPTQSGVKLEAADFFVLMAMESRGRLVPAQEFIAGTNIGFALGVQRLYPGTATLRGPEQWTASFPLPPQSGRWQFCCLVAPAVPGSYTLMLAAGPDPVATGTLTVKSGAQAPTAPTGATSATRFDQDLVSAARLYPAADQPGPELKTISSGGPFGLLVITKATIQFERVASVGPMTVEHPKQPFSVNGTLVTSCCYTAPALPGMYRLQAFGNGRLVAEIPYEVR